MTKLATGITPSGIPNDVLRIEEHAEVALDFEQRALLALDVLDKAAFASAAALAAKAENAAAAALLADAEHKKYAPQSKKQRYDFDF